MKERFLSPRVPGSSRPCRSPRRALGGTVTRPPLVEGQPGTCVSTPAVSAVGGDVRLQSRRQAGGRRVGSRVSARQLWG